tara:strand:+ start:251 stop:505 length:255 start_codon:yes stop_codon:yes gene_type:complete
MTLIKIKTFLKSLFFHVWSGFPKSTQKEIDFRFKICTQECDMYNIEDSTCMMCGCSINQKKIFMNKLAWADQECPQKKWSKIER